MSDYNKTIKKILSFMMLQKKTWKKQSLNWLQIPGQPYRTLIVGAFGFGKKIHYLIW